MHIHKSTLLLGLLLAIVSYQTVRGEEFTWDGFLTCTQTGIEAGAELATNAIPIIKTLSECVGYQPDKIPYTIISTFRVVFLFAREAIHQKPACLLKALESAGKVLTPHYNDFMKNCIQEKI